MLVPGLTSNSMIMIDKNESHNVSKRQTPVAADCGTQFTNLKIGDSGNITSPNYPELYPPSIKCAWWLQVTLTRISMFELFYTYL